MNTVNSYRVSDKDPNVRIYAAGATIIQEGTVDDGCIFILKSGTLAVMREGRLLREMAGAGLLFGEMATILNTPRTATVVAFTECRVAVYSGGLKRIIEQFPSITMKIVAVLAERVQDLTTMCIEAQLSLKRAGLDPVQPLIEPARHQAVPFDSAGSGSARASTGKTPLAH